MWMLKGTSTGAASSTSASTQIDVQSVGGLTACLVEPILSCPGGSLTSRPVTWPRCTTSAVTAGMLLMLDEAQTGLCRTGDWYAFERDGVVPDILTLPSKPLALAYRSPPC